MGMERRNAHRGARRAGVAALLLAVLVGAAGAAGDAAPVTAVPSVDLDRYAGTWFEAARFDNRFQRSCAGDVTATYNRRPDGRLDVINRCRRADGSVTSARAIARVPDAGTVAKLKVRFAPAALSWLPMVWADYWIIGLADDYSWAVVGTPDRKYLWILSRTPALEVAVYERALAVARANGFDPSRLQRTTHAPAAG